MRSATALIGAALAVAAFPRDATAELRRLRFHHGRDGSAHLQADDRLGDFTRKRTDLEVPVWWGAHPQRLVVDPAGTTHVAGDGELEVIRAVLASWNAAAASCDSPARLELEPGAAGEVGFDRVNRVVFRETSWCAPIDCEHYCGPREKCPGGEECYDPQAAALTTLCYDQKTGEILDGDIEVNATTFAIGVDGRVEVGDRMVADLANTFAHEAGHFLGLDHTCWSGVNRQPIDDHGELAPSCDSPVTLAAEITEATMYAYQDDGETKKASLEQDDVDGVCAIYPPVSNPPADGWCVCNTGGGPRSGGWGTLLLAALVTIRLRGAGRRRRA
jgi:hypothetical protein